jgi:23S rRNA G2445 N2-methylase RlmL
MTTDPGDLVLDPTCGSGTTAYVAEQWGRPGREETTHSEQEDAQNDYWVPDANELTNLLEETVQ